MTCTSACSTFMSCFFLSNSCSVCFWLYVNISILLENRCIPYTARKVSTESCLLMTLVSPCFGKVEQMLDLSDLVPVPQALSDSALIYL